MNTQKPAHIAVIDPGGRVPELDNFNRLVLRHPAVRFSYHLPALFGMSSLELLEERADALIIFGSSASVNESLPWQEPLNSWIKLRLDADLPCLGICYGHQLLAHLYGGKVDYALSSMEKYKGLRSVKIEKSDFWDKGSARFIVSHRELVVSLPSDFERCASSEEAEFEIIRHKEKPIWGIQSHPEAGPEFVINSAIPLDPAETKPFHDGDNFMYRFIQHILALKQAES